MITLFLVFVKDFLNIHFKNDTDKNKKFSDGKNCARSAFAERAQFFVIFGFTLLRYAK